MATGFYGVSQVTHEFENPLGWDENDIDLTGVLTDLSDVLTTIHESNQSMFGPPAHKVILLRNFTCSPELRVTPLLELTRSHRGRKRALSRQ